MRMRCRSPIRSGQTTPKASASASSRRRRRGSPGGSARPCASRSSARSQQSTTWIRVLLSQTSLRFRPRAASREPLLAVLLPAHRLHRRGVALDPGGEGEELLQSRRLRGGRATTPVEPREKSAHGRDVETRRDPGSRGLPGELAERPLDAPQHLGRGRRAVVEAHDAAIEVVPDGPHIVERAEPRLGQRRPRHRERGSLSRRAPDDTLAFLPPFLGTLRGHGEAALCAPSGRGDGQRLVKVLETADRPEGREIRRTRRAGSPGPKVVGEGREQAPPKIVERGTGRACLIEEHGIVSSQVLPPNRAARARRSLARAAWWALRSHMKA
jgi:hypothetical protein